MIRLKTYFTGMMGLVLLAMLLVSCEKTFDEKLVQQNDLSNNAIVQVVVATINAAGNQLFVEGKQVTGTALVTGGIFPTSGYGFAATPGLRPFLVTGSGTQQPLSFAENLQAAKHYTVFLYDTITAPKQKTVLDDIVVPSDTTTRLRLANFVYSPNAIPAIDVFSYVRNANIFSNVNVTDVTPYIPYMGFQTDTLYIRDAGTTNTFIKVTLSGGLTSKRNYTLLVRGSYRAAGRVATLIANR